MDRLNLERLRSDRKRTLFACACVREVWHLLEHERSRRAVEVAEGFADGRATRHDLAISRDAAWDAAYDPRTVANYVTRTAGRAAYRATGEPALKAAEGAAFIVVLASGRAAQKEGLRAQDQAWNAARQKQALLLDDIAGPDPLPDVPRTPTVTALAEAIYQERRWADMAILADALEEAGLVDAGVLSHLRGPGPHAKGCFVLDLILQRE